MTTCVFIEDKKSTSPPGRKPSLMHTVCLPCPSFNQMEDSSLPVHCVHILCPSYIPIFSAKFWITINILDLPSYVIYYEVERLRFFILQTGLSSIFSGSWIILKRQALKCQCFLFAEVKPESWYFGLRYWGDYEHTLTTHLRNPLSPGHVFLKSTWGYWPFWKYLGM